MYKTLSYSEKAKGWVSFKSFVPENGLSMSSSYFTLKNGRLYKHYEPQYDAVTNEINNYNEFYGSPYNTTVNVLLNDSPSVIKLFSTLNYEGSDSKIDQLTTVDTNDTNYFTYQQDYITSVNTFDDGEYYNLTNKDGWYVEDIHTDAENGRVNEFIKKEGKWFNYIKGKSVNANIYGQVSSDPMNLRIQGPSVLGLGTLIGPPVNSTISGCTCDGIDLDEPCATFYTNYGQAAAFNYDPNANINDGSCAPVVLGCTDPTATNYDPTANTDDGSCVIPGCTCNGDQVSGSGNVTDCGVGGTLALPGNPTDLTATYQFPDATVAAFNYNPLATVDDGTCTPVIIGCTDNSTQTEQDSSGNGTVYTYATMFNYDPTANTLGNCIPTEIGCLDLNATNYNNGDPWTNDPSQDVNTQSQDPAGCQYSILGCNAAGACNPTLVNPNDPSQIFGVNLTVVDDGSSCTFCGDDGSGSAFWSVNLNQNIWTNGYAGVTNFDNSPIGTCTDPIYDNDRASCLGSGNNWTPCATGCKYCLTPGYLALDPLVTPSTTTDTSGVVTSSITIQWQDTDYYGAQNNGELQVTGYATLSAANVQYYELVYTIDTFDSTTGLWTMGTTPTTLVIGQGTNASTLDPSTGMRTLVWDTIPQPLFYPTGVGSGRNINIAIRSYCGVNTNLYTFQQQPIYSYIGGGTFNPDLNGTLTPSTHPLNNYTGGAPPNVSAITAFIPSPQVPGCTDPLACTYNATANFDDGTCDYSCIGCNNPSFIEYWDYTNTQTTPDPTINCTSNQQQVISGCIPCNSQNQGTLFSGCPDPTAQVVNTIYGNFSAGYTNYAAGTDADCNGTPIAAPHNGFDTSCCISPVYGCNDTTTTLYGTTNTGATNQDCAHDNFNTPCTDGVTTNIQEHCQYNQLTVSAVNNLTSDPNSNMYFEVQTNGSPDPALYADAFLMPENSITSGGFGLPIIDPTGAGVLDCITGNQSQFGCIASGGSMFQGNPPAYGTFTSTGTTMSAINDNQGNSHSLTTGMTQADLQHWYGLGARSIHFALTIQYASPLDGSLAFNSGPLMPRYKYYISEHFELIAGCMDSNYYNYNPLATVDDGSCVVSGSCTPLFFDKVYMPPQGANWPGFNFNPTAETILLNAQQALSTMVGLAGYSSSTNDYSTFITADPGSASVNHYDNNGNLFSTTSSPSNGFANPFNDPADTFSYTAPDRTNYIAAGFPSEVNQIVTYISSTAGVSDPAKCETCPELSITANNPTVNVSQYQIELQLFPGSFRADFVSSYPTHYFGARQPGHLAAGSVCTTNPHEQSIFQMRFKTRKYVNGSFANGTWTGWVYHEFNDNGYNITSQNPSPHVPNAAINQNANGTFEGSSCNDKIYISAGTPSQPGGHTEANPTDMAIYPDHGTYPNGYANPAEQNVQFKVQLKRICTQPFRGDAYSEPSGWSSTHSFKV